MEKEYTLIGGILRFQTMARVVSEKLNAEVNVPAGDMVQYATAMGAAILGTSVCGSCIRQTRS